MEVSFAYTGCVIRGADKVGVPAMCNWKILNGGAGLGGFGIKWVRRRAIPVVMYRGAG